MPIVDARDLPDKTEIEADLVIIGGGMAGGAVARALAAGPLKIAVLESGGLTRDDAVQDLYRGSGVCRAPGGQEKPFDDYLVQSRTRLLGGSGHVWGGKCVPLDPADFARREWVAHSGWPMSRRQLQPFIDRACDLLEIPHFDPDAPTPRDPARPALALGPGDGFFSAPRYFTRYSGQVDRPAFDRFRQDFAGATNVTVYLNANVTELKLDPKTERIERLDVACLNGRRHTARGRTYVLATGGIENARLLLASNSVRKEGVGNRHDLVGRFFQGHQTFSYDGGGGSKSMLALTDAPNSLSLYTDVSWGSGKAQCVLASSLAGQRRHRIGACTATMFGPGRTGPDTPAIHQLAAAVDGGSAGALQNFFFMSEHRPNPDSRVSLGDTADALGMPRVRLEWTYSKADWDGLEAGIAALAGDLGSAGVARVCWPLARNELLKAASPSRHHMGTTRMHADPAEGVVDPEGRVHGTPNLYVAGSSVFPTSGIANPTLTLLALALRMSDHLKQEMGAGA